MNMKSIGKETNYREELSVETDKPNIVFHPPTWFQINKFSVAVGLLWQPLRNDLSLKQQAKLASGNKNNLDLFRMASNSKQVGFASSKEGFGPNMLAGANQFDQKIPFDSWLAAFKLAEDSDHWWIVAKRYGAIYQDKVFNSRKTAFDEFSTLIKAPDWKRIYAPDDWEIKDAQKLILAEALTFVPNMGLKPINQNRRWLFVVPVIIGFVALTLFVGNRVIEKFVNLGDNQFQTETLEIQPEIPKPWVGKSKVGEFTRTCLELMEDLFFLSPGWKLNSLVCTQNETKYLISLTVNRDPVGSPGYLRQLAFRKSGVEITMGCNGNCANAQLEKVIPEPQSRENEQPWKANKVDKILRERFQTIHAVLHLNQRGPRNLPQSSVSSNAITSRHDFSIRTGFGVKEYASLLKDIPGIAPETLVFTPSNNTWLLTAKIFHLNEMLQPSDEIQF